MSKQKLLTAAAILAATDVKSEVVDVPEWGGSIRVQGSAENRDVYESFIYTLLDAGEAELDLTNYRAKLAAACIVDEDGKRLFTDDQVCELGRKSTTALQRVADAARRVLGLEEEQVVKNG